MGPLGPRQWLCLASFWPHVESLGSGGEGTHRHVFYILRRRWCGKWRALTTELSSILFFRSAFPGSGEAHLQRRERRLSLAAHVGISLWRQRLKLREVMKPLCPRSLSVGLAHGPKTMWMPESGVLTGLKGTVGPRCASEWAQLVPAAQKPGHCSPA